MEALQRRPSLVIVAAFAMCGMLSFGLVACADEAEGSAASGASQTDGSTDGASDAGEPAEPEPTPQECLIGEWRFLPDEMQSYYDSFTPDGAKITVGGEVLLALEGSDYEFNPEFDLEIDVGVVAEGHLVGPIGGTYVADDETLTTTQTYSEARLDVEAMGQQMDGTDQMEAFLEMFQINEQPYECDGDSLTLHLKAGSAGVQPVGLERVS